MPADGPRLVVLDRAHLVRGVRRRAAVAAGHRLLRAPRPRRRAGRRAGRPRPSATRSLGRPTPLECNRHVLHVQGLAVDPRVPAAGHRPGGCSRRPSPRRRAGEPASWACGCWAGTPGAGALRRVPGSSSRACSGRSSGCGGRYVDDVLMARPLGDQQVASSDCSACGLRRADRQGVAGLHRDHDGGVRAAVGGVRAAPTRRRSSRPSRSSPPAWSPSGWPGRWRRPRAAPSSRPPRPAPRRRPAGRRGRSAPARRRP